MMCVYIFLMYCGSLWDGGRGWGRGREERGARLEVARPKRLDVLYGCRMAMPMLAQVLGGTKKFGS